MHKIIVFILFSISITLAMPVKLSVSADIFDPLDGMDVAVTDTLAGNTSPDVVTLPGVEPTVTEAPTDSDGDTADKLIQEKKERTIKRKAKACTDVVSYGCGALLAISGLGCSLLMMFALTMPSIFDRIFHFFTKFSVFTTPKLKYWLVCLTVSTIGILLCAGVFEDIQLKFFGWLIYKLTY